jgi:penicillin-binding protein 1B
VARHSRLRRIFRPRVLLPLVVVAAAVFSLYVLYLDVTIRTKFEGKRWALPARVYATPLELYPGKKLSVVQFSEELVSLGYRLGTNQEPGYYARGRDSIDVVSRPFVFWDGPQPSQQLRVTFQGNVVGEIRDTATDQPLPIARLDPPLIGGIYPAHNEDRILVKLAEVPPLLVQTLIAVEDRKYYEHHGIDLRGIARALWVNLRARGAVQGGSTLTQQLVKNFYLTDERTLRRKATEAIMAVLLDAHYSKAEILEAYINEIYLGQDSNRAIHGFGLAAQHYFERSLPELTLPQIALLVGLVKGPSFYDPRRHPQRALARRNLILAELAERGVISTAEHLRAKASPLGVAARAPVGTSPYPAFLNLVHRQLRHDYSESDLRSEGLSIFTTLDLRAQRAAEQALESRLATIEKQRRLPGNSLEGAMVITSTDSGEVLAVVGGRRSRYEGFNRALDAQRAIGSLMKPVIYLTALSQPDKYTLTTLLDDRPLVWKDQGATQEWAPQNYDKQFHGDVDMRTALAYSYNVSAARLGLTLGLPTVIQTARQLGVERNLPPYGATLLGAIGMTPFEVTQMYQTIASGGFRMPLRAIREVMTPEGEPLKRYALAVEKTVDPSAVYVLTTGMQNVVRNGTATGLQAYLSLDLNIAGKTGTTDDLRDSWFAGFSGDKLGVVWIGRDDNGPMGLTGSSGALTVWGQAMASLDPEPLIPVQPETVELVAIDPQTRLRADGCSGAVEIAFIRGTAPTESAPCVDSGAAQSNKGFFRRLFGR